MSLEFDWASLTPFIEQKIRDAIVNIPQSVNPMLSSSISLLSMDLGPTPPSVVFKKISALTMNRKKVSVALSYRGSASFEVSLDMNLNILGATTPSTNSLKFMGTLYSDVPMVTKCRFLASNFDLYTVVAITKDTDTYFEFDEYPSVSFTLDSNLSKLGPLFDSAMKRVESTVEYAFYCLPDKIFITFFMFSEFRLMDNKSSEWLAHRFYVMGEIDMCLNVVDQVLRKNPDNPEVLSLKGHVLMSKGRVEEALVFFEIALQFDEKNVRHLLEIAKCYHFLGRFQHSLAVLLDIQETGNGNIWEVDHLMGLNYYRLRKNNEAIDSFQNALDSDFRVETVIELINVYESENDSSSIFALIKEARNKHPTNCLLLKRVGKYFLSQRMFSEALEEFSLAIERDPSDFQSVLMSASIEQHNQNIDTAIGLYRKAFIGVPNSTALWNNASLCIMSRNKSEASISCCIKSSMISPFESIPLTNLGLNYLDVGRYCSAAICLKRALKLDPGCEGANEGLAVALMNLGEYKPAIKLLEKELQKYSSHRLLINLAICYFHSNDYVNANETFQRFLKLVADEPAIESLYPINQILIPMFNSKIKE